MNQFTQKDRYHLVILLCASALNEAERFDEVVSDNGILMYVGGQIRMEAAVDFAPNVERYVVVGGDHKCGKEKKVTDMKKFLEKRFDEIGLPDNQQPKIFRLYSETDTTGNLWALKRFLKDKQKLDWLKNKRIGILTNFYHLLRAMRFAADIFNDPGVHFIPLSAEAMIYRYEPTYVFHPEATLRRIAKELDGLNAWERHEYLDRQGRHAQERAIDEWNYECFDENDFLNSLNEPTDRDASVGKPGNARNLP